MPYNMLVTVPPPDEKDVLCAWLWHSSKVWYMRAFGGCYWEVNVPSIRDKMSFTCVNLTR